MKTLVFSVVFALTSVVNSVSNNSLAGFAYNTTLNEDRVETQTVYKVENDKYLQNHLKYCYTYDVLGRVSAKEVLKWNKDTQCFDNQYCLNFSYNGTEVNVEYAAWDYQTKAYTNVKAKSVYQIDAKGVNYQSYEWSKKDNSWNLKVEHGTQAEEVILFAEK